MISTVPQIGFDRFIQLDWVACALKVRANLSSIDELNVLLDAASLGVAARKKTRTVLNRLWLEPRPELTDFADRGARIYKEQADISASALSWGMAIATYPFFGKVAELMGRLSALQGDCTSAELHRRMSEIYGEREGTYRMTNMVLQSQSGWGALERVDKGKRLVRTPLQMIGNEALTAWMIEAAVRHVGKPLSALTMSSLPAMFPFGFTQSIAYVASNNSNLELRSEGPGNQFVALRESI
jgi:hypothetical protein